MRLDCATLTKGFFLAMARQTHKHLGFLNPDAVSGIPTYDIIKWPDTHIPTHVLTQMIDIFDCQQVVICNQSKL